MAPIIVGNAAWLGSGSLERWRRRGLGAAALAALVAALASPPGTSLAASQPDLKVEYQGLQTTTLTLPTAIFKVTNVGTAKSDYTFAFVKTLTPPLINPQSLTVPPLAVGKAFVFTYALDAACNGNDKQVQVDVYLYNDANPADNTLQTQVCIPESAVHGVRVVGVEVPTPITAPNHPVVDTQLCTVQDPLTCPGTHTIDLQPSAQSRGHQERHSSAPVAGCSPTGTAEGSVGWDQDGGCVVTVDRVAVAFADMGVLDKIPSRLIASATLGFDEQKVDWTDTDGSPRNVDGCVTTLGIATEDWIANPPQDRQVQDDLYLDFTPQNVHEFVVTVPFAQQLANQTPRWGFVLRGAIDSVDDLDNNGRSSCLSMLSNIHMHVTYVVPDAS